MRVLYVNHTSRVSGGELSLLALLEALPAEVEPIVACPEGDLHGRVRELGIEAIPIRGTDGSLRLHPVRTPRALAEMALAARQVAKAAAATGAGAVHANSIRAGIVSVAAGGRGGLPTVVHVRDCLPPGPLTTLTLRAIGRADRLIANSEYTRGTLGRAADRAEVVYNAVDLSRFDPARVSRDEARGRLGLTGEGPVLGVVAQITPWKGQDDAIGIADALRAAAPGVRLLLVGSPKFDSASTRYDNAAFMRSLEEQVAARGLGDNVRFVGEREDVAEAMAALDLLLVPSWEEPFGRSVIEAMALGVPVVATALGGPPEILGRGDDRCGLVLPPRRPAEWAEEIRSLLDDPDERRGMSERGRARARGVFSPERHAEAVLAVYEKVGAGTA